jgi:hypothetical protein
MYGVSVPFYANKRKIRAGSHYLSLNRYESKQGFIFERKTTEVMRGIL